MRKGKSDESVENLNWCRAVGFRFPWIENCIVDRYVVKELRICWKVRTVHAKGVRLLQRNVHRTAHNLVQCQFLHYHLPFSHNSSAMHVHARINRKGQAIFTAWLPASGCGWYCVHCVRFLPTKRSTNPKHLYANTYMYVDRPTDHTFPFHFRVTTISVCSLPPKNYENWCESRESVRQSATEWVSMCDVRIAFHLFDYI